MIVLQKSPTRIRLASGCALLASACWSALAQQPPASADALDANTGIISVRYHCPDHASGVCETAVPRGEFDALVRAMNPDMSQSDRQILAAEYARLLIMAAHARERGIDQSPEFQTLLKFSTMQLLSSELVRKISGSTSPVTSDAEETYYRDHARDYREVTVIRIFVPPLPNHKGQGPAATAARAEAIRARVMKGEDFGMVQREVAGGSPEAQPLPVSCLSLPEAHRHVCDLQPGENSAALPDSGGFSIYRLVTRRDRSLSEVRPEIHDTLERQQLQERIAHVRTPVSLDLDERYFGKLPPPDVAHQHGMQFPASKKDADPHAAHKH